MNGLNKWFVRLLSVVAEAKQAINYVRTIAHYCWPYRGRLILLGILSLVVSAPSLAIPLIMRSIIDTAYPSRDFTMFIWLCFAMVFLRITGGLFGTVSLYISTYVRNMLEYRLSLRIFNAIQHLPKSYLEQYGSGVFIERSSKDVQSISQSMTYIFPQIAAIVFTLVAAVVIMFRLTIGITCLVLAVIPLNYIVTTLLAHKLRKLSMADKVISEKLTTFTAETMEGVETSLLYSLKRQRRQKFIQLLRDHLKFVFAIWRIIAVWGQINAGIAAGWGLLLICGGWYLVLSDYLMLGEAVALGMYINVITRPFHQLASLYQSIINSSVSAERVQEVLNAKSITSSQPGRNLYHPPQCIELIKVMFSYPNRPPCLRELDLRLEAGETVAIIGPTGAGKSTLLRLIANLENSFSGQILIDGNDIRTINTKSYIKYVSFIMQKDFFFNDSILDNLSIDNKRPLVADIVHKAKALGVVDFVDLLPKRYETILGDKGRHLSSGQLQKLAILRSMVKEPALLLLDELTSCVDIESERNLLKSIIQLRPEGCITVLVTHRLDLTKNPWIDKVVVLAEGQIVEMGSPRELYEQGGLYYRWLTMDENDLIPEFSGKLS